jgi:thioredoxin-related protein
MELTPNDFNRANPHVPKNMDLSTAILFKMNGCGWCDKMQIPWQEASEKLAFMNMYTFTVNKNSENATHWEKIKNSLETQIEGFPTIIFYKGDQALLYDQGYLSSKDIIKKMIEFEEEN